MKNSLRLLFICFISCFAFLPEVQAQNCQAAITAAGNTNVCDGDSVKLTASPGLSYLWNNGKTTQSIWAKTSGNYVVSVTNPFGCAATSAPVMVSVMGPPDAALQDTVDNFMNCTYSLGTSSFNLTVDNISSTKATNTQYSIDWGDGSSNVYGSNFTGATHAYTLPGSFNLKFKVTNAAGCTSTKTYLVFNGSNPSFGVASQGNTNDCAPATFTFDIINTQNNTPSTVYTFQFDDGTPAITYTHANLPKTITHTFLKSAMGKPGNAFTLTAYATNPCGTTPATVGGIRISATPIADFLVNPDSIGCVNAPVTLTDFSNGGFNANASGSLTTGFTREWVIKPATGWSFTNGTNNTSPQPVLNFTNTGNYTISLIVTPRGSGAKCQADTASKTITIRNAPKAGFSIIRPATSCAPAQITMQNQFVNPEFTYLWQVSPKQGWSFAGNSDSVSVHPQFTFTQAGTYTVKLTTTNYCGQTQTVDSTVVIQGTPTVSLPADKDYCVNETVAFSSKNPAHQPTITSNSPVLGYNWNVIGNGFQFVNGTTATSQYPEIKFTKAGIFQVIFKAENMCGISAADTQMVVIHPAPQINIQSSVTAICEGQGIATLMATGADTYQWFPATGLNTTSGNTVTANPTVTTTYSVIGKNALTGCQDTATYTVVVKPAIPLAVTSSLNAICEGQQTTTLTATGANVYTWSPAIGLNSTTGASVIASPSVTTTYTVTALDTTAGCVATKTITVTVLPKPLVNIGNDTTICANPQGLQLNAFPQGGTWSGQNISHKGFFVGSAVGNYTVTYTYTNANGCTNAVSKKITVVPMPVAFAGNDTTFCAENPTVSLKGLPNGGTWSGSNLVTANGTFTANIAGTYTLTYTYGNGNCEVTDQVVITVNPLPTAPVVQPQTICPGTMATLLATGSANIFEWYETASGGNVIFTGAAFSTPALQTSKTYYVAAYNQQGCVSSARTPVTVTVNPTVSAAVVADATVCGPGSQATLTASGAAGTYKWYDTALNGKAIFTGATFQTPALNATTSYYMEAVSTEGCPSPARTKVTVTVLPNLSNNTIFGTQTICENQVPVAFTGTAPTGGNAAYIFEWESSIDSLNYTVIAGATSANYAPAALNQVTWFRRKVTSGPCVNYSQPVKIEVIALPAAPIKTSQTICAGATATFSVSAANASVTPGSGVKYEWFTSATGGQVIFTGNQFTTPALQTTTTYFVEAVNAQGCRSVTRTPFVVTVLQVVSNNTIANPQTICENGTPAPLTGSLPNGGNGTYTYLWESSADNVNFTAALGNNASATYAPGALTQNTWFRRVVMSGPCSQHTSASVIITVIPAIANNLVTSPVQIICAGSAPQTLTATQPTGGTGSYTYQWEMSTTSANTGFVPAPNVNQNLNYSAPILQQTTWFRRVVTSGNCSEASVAVKVEVNPPLASNIISAPQMIYSGSVPSLLQGSTPAGGNGNYTYTWEMSTIGNSTGFVALSVNTPDYQPAATTQTTWFRRIVRSGDCELVSNVIALTVVPAIANNVISQDQTICENNTPDLLTGTQPVGGIGNYTYLWEMSTTNATTGFSTASGVANQATYQPGILTETTWFRRSVISGAYIMASNAVKITVNPNISNNTISISQTICAGSAPAILLGSTPAGGSGNYAYLWEMSTTGQPNSFVNAPGVNTALDYNPGVLQQTTWFRRKISAGHCFDNISAAVQITVNQIPAPATLEAQDICSGTQAIVVIPATNQRDMNTEYEWYETAIGGQLIAKGTSFTTPVLTESKTYYVQAVQYGCVSTRVAVEVRVLGNTADAGQDLEIISGKNAQLYGKGGVTYKWFPVEGLSNPNIANPIANPTKTTTYKLEVVSEAGCISTDEVTVTVLPKIKIVNTFSPNNDGINDTWEIKGLEEYRNARIEIFNRWGAKVYQSTGYPNPWNGVSMTGEALPVATYYYIIYLNKEEAPVSGSITIIR